MLDSEYLHAGTISGVFGIKGYVKVFSHTEPRENILKYSPWYLRKNQQVEQVEVLSGQLHGGNVVARLDGLSDRDAALAWIGAEILILKRQLPKPKPGEYYWSDLVGLNVTNTQGVYLGRVDHLLETGANDVLVVLDAEVERLIPFIQQHTVLNIDLSAGSMLVDWDPDF
ncbi:MULTISPECIES: ribosome maturation factor RimM [Methylomonas]|uniref:ribosome maturation factor RimM n=1 Tax=Methylomonas TaxID=416 RepID=UPI0012324C46|nr:ribosome maturation factor RimM [Methylomonas rhizoryzae]